MLRVLSDRGEPIRARALLRARGLSFVEPNAVVFARRVARKLGLSRSVSLGDVRKSWDVLTTLDFLTSRCLAGAAVLDFGAFASEIVPALDRLGFRVCGVDLNPQLSAMPRGRGIRYEVADFKHTPFGADAFDAITAISVIEHGYEPEPLLAEIARLLRPGGCFIASFDYWPTKLDVGSARPFDMSWTVFSHEDVQDLVDRAARHGLEPAGPLTFEAQAPTIRYAGLDYTFAWLALVRRAEA